MLRNPILPLGLGFALWLLWSIDPRTEDWSGSSYEGMAMSSVSLMWAISVAAAVAFHRERVPVAVGAPVPEVVRVLARLAALVPLLAPVPSPRSSPGASATSVGCRSGPSPGARSTRCTRRPSCSSTSPWACSPSRSARSWADGCATSPP